MDQFDRDNLRYFLTWLPIIIIGIFYELDQYFYEKIYKIFHGGKSPWNDNIYDELR